MPCLKLPVPQIPPLPAPFGIGPPKVPVPPIPGLPNFCCKLPPVKVPIPPIPLPAAVLAAQTEIIKQAVDKVVAYCQSLPLDCPLE